MDTTSAEFILSTLIAAWALGYCFGKGFLEFRRLFDISSS